MRLPFAALDVPGGLLELRREEDSEDRSEWRRLEDLSEWRRRSELRRLGLLGVSSSDACQPKSEFRCASRSEMSEMGPGSPGYRPETPV
eukprot:CAMPEP_0205903538 /NCGR_PEP_ID=MMETSP1325-20131115/164_1 /ASSEMBLY_ACC=CAM_ASM_000708 /TAXON_ID=236786 /ORGANISM="Florenciella sp., Strain RCC1007" /LENGTH=88 /DNA_ID=CAMNT_0053269201 /DNA_START=126 /DNA_END=394 /DNA_ORIENTATION=+